MRWHFLTTAAFVHFRKVCSATMTARKEELNFNPNASLLGHTKSNGGPSEPLWTETVPKHMIVSDDVARERLLCSLHLDSLLLRLAILTPINIRYSVKKHSA